MRINYSKIKKRSIELSPYPHFICDGILDENFLDQIKKNWPKRNFTDDNKGNNLFLFSSEIKFLEKSQREFWTELIINDVQKLSKLLIDKFYHFIIRKATNGLMEYGTGYAMENLEKKNPQDFIPHTHFDHDPLWVITFLIYIDDKNKNAPGTSMYSIGETNDNKITNFLKWNEIWNSNLNYLEQKDKIENLGFKLVKTSEFKRNRMFCFYDGPFSFHSVNYIESPLIVERKVLRFAIGFQRKEILNLYNYPQEEWINIFKKKQTNKINKILNQEVKLLKKNLFFSFFKKKIKLSNYPITL